MDFYEIMPEDLSDMYKGLRMVERLSPEGVANLDIHLYGITSDPKVLTIAKEESVVT